MFKNHKNFINWASSYEDDKTEIKSKKIHKNGYLKLIALLSGLNLKKV